MLQWFVIWNFFIWLIYKMKNQTFYPRDQELHICLVLFDLLYLVSCILPLFNLLDKIIQLRV